MTDREEATGPTQQQVDRAREALKRPRDDDEDPQAADGTTRDPDTDPDARGSGD